nr:zinc finger, CCHC-type [Tanacetum cinerariifolium]
MYTAENVCHEEMVKMPLVDLKVLETSCRRVYRRHLGLHEIKGGARVAFEDEFKATEEREVLCEAQQGRSGVKRKLFGSFRNKIGVRDEECNLDRSRASTTHFQSVGLNMRQRRSMELFSDYGCETKYHMGMANIVVDAWRRKGGVKPRRVRDICRTIQAKISEKMLVADIGESKMIGLEMEQETTKVVMIKEAKDRVVCFGKKSELTPRYVGPLDILERFFARLSEGNWNLLCIRHESKKTAWPIMVRNKEDNNEAVVLVKKIDTHELLTFNNTVDCEAGIFVTNDLLDEAKENMLGIGIIKDQGGNTLRVSRSRVYKEKLLLHLDYCFVRLDDGSMVLEVRRKGYERASVAISMALLRKLFLLLSLVKDLEFFDCPGPRQGVKELMEDREAEVFQVSNDDTVVAQRRLEDKQPEKTNTDCLVKEQEKEYSTGWKIKTEDTTMSIYLVNRSSSPTIGFKTPVDMLGIVGNKLWILDDVTSKVVLYRNMGFTKSGEYKKTFIGSGEVQTQDLIYYHLASDREQHSTHELFSYREDINEAAFAVAEAKKIYAHESLTFNNTVACEVISKWKTGLEDDMDAQSDVYVLSNDDMVFLADARLRSGLPSVCWIKQREMYLVWRSSGIRVGTVRWTRMVNGHIYAVGSQEYQMVCTRHDIASADVGMLDGFDRGLQTNVQVLWILTTPWALSTTEAAYMTLTKDTKEAIWLKGLAIKSGFELKIVAGIATGALSKAIPSPRFQHWLKLLRIEEG